MKSYFRIGEVSALFNIPLQTLRYYDKIGLFSPAYINKETGYRYYCLHQFPLLHQIKIFKSMEIPFSDIKELMRTEWDANKMDKVYTAQLKRLEQIIKEMQVLQSELKAKRKYFLTLQSQPKNQILLKQCKTREIFSRPINVSTYKEQEMEYYRAFLPFSNEINYFNLDPGIIVTQSTFFNDRINASYLFLVNPTIVPQGFHSHHIAEGTYLSILIEDSYEQAPTYYNMLRQYILKRKIEVIGDIYEFCYDIFPNNPNNISVWELQVQINPLTLQSL